jgi:hypothetical protein
MQIGETGKHWLALDCYLFMRTTIHSHGGGDYDNDDDDNDNNNK